MRRPSTEAALYAWHRRALANQRPVGGTAEPVYAEEPQCGWFKMRLVRGGPWVPVIIWCEQEIEPETGELTAPERLLARIGSGPVQDATAAWPRCAARPITEDEYLSLLGRHETDDTMRATHAPVDLTAKPMRP